MTLKPAGILVVATAIAASVILVRSVRLAVLILTAIGAVAWIAYVAYGWWLRWRWERSWARERKRILLVYSRSPNWQSYIEQNWLPRIGDSAVLLNWSERASWSRAMGLEVRSFRYWAGSREFNPIAILFPAHGKVHAIRFWRAFRNFKHGKDAELRKAEEELFAFAARENAQAV